MTGAGSRLSLFFFVLIARIFGPDVVAFVALFTVTTLQVGFAPGRLARSLAVQRPVEVSWCPGIWTFLWLFALTPFYGHSSGSLFSAVTDSLRNFVWLRRI